jgi:hypothetical protein
MTEFATLNGQRIMSGNICMPYFGMWSGDVVLSSDAVITSNVIVTVGNLTLVGYAYRTASFTGSRSARLVAGNGGWRKSVAAQGYYNPAGILKSLLSGDAASLVGETVLVTQDISVGSAYVREAAPAERLIRNLFGDTWYVDTKGVLQAQDRVDFSPISSPFTVVSWSGGKGSFEIATEDLASWLPGRTFSDANVTSTQKVSAMTIDMTNDGPLRTMILAQGHENA